MNKAEILKSTKSQRRLLEEALANLASIEQTVSQLPAGAIRTPALKSALDGAFLRRLRFIVEFPIPDAGGQRKLWEMVFPESLPK